MCIKHIGVGVANKILFGIYLYALSNDLKHNKAGFQQLVSTDSLCMHAYESLRCLDV